MPIEVARETVEITSAQRGIAVLSLVAFILLAVVFNMRESGPEWIAGLDGFDTLAVGMLVAYPVAVWWFGNPETQ